MGDKDCPLCDVDKWKSTQILLEHFYGQGLKSLARIPKQAISIRGGSTDTVYNDDDMMMIKLITIM